MLLVTGITGFSGTYFLQYMVKNNFQDKMRCVVRETSDTKYIDQCDLNIEKCVGDLSDLAFLNSAMRGIDTVLHIGSIFYSINVIEAATRNNVRRAIFVHTTGIYSNFKSASKEYKNIESNIEDIIRRSNSHIGLIYLRPTMIYGYLNDRNMSIFINLIDRYRVFPVLNHGSSLLQPVNGRDLGKAYFQILEKPDIMYGDYILSGEKPISMLEMLKLISEILNKKTIFISVPLIIGIFFAYCLKLITLGKIDFVERVQRMSENRSFSHEKASRDFNYQPTSLKEGLIDEIDAYIKNTKKCRG